MIKLQFQLNELNSYLSGYNSTLAETLYPTHQDVAEKIQSIINTMEEIRLQKEPNGTFEQIYSALVLLKGKWQGEKTSYPIPETIKCVDEITKLHFSTFINNQSQQYKFSDKISIDGLTKRQLIKTNRLLTIVCMVLLKRLGNESSSREHIRQHLIDLNELVTQINKKCSELPDEEEVNFDELIKKTENADFDVEDAIKKFKNLNLQPNIYISPKQKMTYVIKITEAANRQKSLFLSAATIVQKSIDDIEQESKPLQLELGLMVQLKNIKETAKTLPQNLRNQVLKCTEHLQHRIRLFQKSVQLLQNMKPTQDIYEVIRQGEMLVQDQKDIQTKLNLLQNKIDESQKPNNSSDSTDYSSYSGLGKRYRIENPQVNTTDPKPTQNHSSNESRIAKRYKLRTNVNPQNTSTHPTDTLPSSSVYSQALSESNSMSISQTVEEEDEEENEEEKVRTQLNQLVQKECAESAVLWKCQNKLNCLFKQDDLLALRTQTENEFYNQFYGEANYGPLYNTIRQFFGITDDEFYAASVMMDK